MKGFNMGLTKEANPFLGYRAIRFCLDRVDIFTTQLRAILRASAYGSIRIMIPMITSVNEVRQVKELIKKICSDLDRNGINYDKNIQTGIMIETPAAAVMADAIVRLLPGAIGDEQSALSDSFQDNLLAPPVYTRPAEYKGWRVPDILLSGHQAKVDEWRLQQAMERTERLRPDLLEKKD